MPSCPLLNHPKPTWQWKIPWNSGICIRCPDVLPAEHDWIFGAGSFVAVQFNTHLRSTSTTRYPLGNLGATHVLLSWLKICVNPPWTLATTRTKKHRMCISPSWIADFLTCSLTHNFGAYLRLSKGRLWGPDLDSSRALRTVSRSSWEQHVLHSAVEVLNTTPFPLCCNRLRLFILPNQHLMFHFDSSSAEDFSPGDPPRSGNKME